MRLWGRKHYDALFCKTWSDIEGLGKCCIWHIKTGELNTDSIIYCAGVGNDVSFERDLVARCGATIRLFDPTPTGIRTMQLDENQIKQFQFYPIGLAGNSGAIKFAKPKHPQEGSYTSPCGEVPTVEFICKSLGLLMKEAGHTRIDLLKMDIEGFEYDVISEIIRDKIDVKQICVEFHHFIDGIPRKKTCKAIADLKASGYLLIHKTRHDYTFYRMK